MRKSGEMLIYGQETSTVSLGRTIKILSGLRLERTESSYTPKTPSMMMKQKVDVTARMVELGFTDCWTDKGRIVLYRFGPFF